mgnify:CR=1 FL=1
MGLDFTGLGSVADFATSIVERIWPKKMDDAEKAKAILEVQNAIRERENRVIDAQRSIIVAEMEQGDAYTKRARPTVVYAGLLFIFLVHVVIPFARAFGAQDLPDLALPGEFWWAWSGTVGIWILGRSAEKKGAKNQIIQAITGGK